MSVEKDDIGSLSREIAVDVLPPLNRDIAVNVLSRLPTKNLVRLKCVSKEWHRLISENNFIKIHLKRREPISGFFFQERFKWTSDDIKTISYIPVKEGVAELQRKIFDFLPEDVVLLAKSNGLICCRSCFDSYPQYDLFLYICNPLTKQWISMDYVKPDKNHIIALAFDPHRDLLDNSTNFKLVRVWQFETDMEALCFSFETYSSSTGSWKKSEEVCFCDNNLYKNSSIYVCGVLHWMTDGDQLLTFSLDTELSWLVSLPLPAAEFQGIPEACIGESDGRLHYVSISDYGFQVWSLDDYFESRWSLKHSKTLQAMEKEHPESFYNLYAKVIQRRTVGMVPWLDPLSFFDGHLLLRVCGKFFIYNFELSRLQDVSSIPKLCENSMFCPMVLPYACSLVPLREA